jgi:hypothetical protein
VPSVFDKLNLKDQPDVVVLNAPESFESELKTLDGREIRRKVSGNRPVSFAIAFVKKQAEIPAGRRWARRDSSRCGWSPSTKTGRLSASVAPTS